MMMGAAATKGNHHHPMLFVNSGFVLRWRRHLLLGLIGLVLVAFTAKRNTITFVMENSNTAAEGTDLLVMTAVLRGISGAADDGDESQQTDTASTNAHTRQQQNNDALSPSQRQRCERRKRRPADAPTAVMCAIAHNEEAYLDEWVNYHHGLGFDHIYIYDNSDNNELRQWGDEKNQQTTSSPCGPQHVNVTHWPGEVVQLKAYNACARHALERKHTWAAFYDIDEFLVLRKHDQVTDFLTDHCASGTISVNWIRMATGGRSVYSPLPVTMRFQYQDVSPSGLQKKDVIKSIHRVQDIDFHPGRKTPFFPPPFINQHFALIKPGTTLKDTNGKTNPAIFSDPVDVYAGASNFGGPTDVAVLYHYTKRSHKEYIDKRMRGRAGVLRDHASNDEWLELAKTEVFLWNETLFDDSAWNAVKEYVPDYAWYDRQSIIPPPV